MGFTSIIIDQVVAADFIAVREQVSRLIIDLFNKNNQRPTCFKINKLIFYID